MSIESNLDSIAKSLEIIAKVLSNPLVTTGEKPVKVSIPVAPVAQSVFESHADFAKYMSDSYMEIVKKGGPIDGVAKSKKIMEILESKGVKFVNQVTPDMYADIKAAVEELKND